MKLTLDEPIREMITGVVELPRNGHEVEGVVVSPRTVTVTGGARDTVFNLHLGGGRIGTFWNEDTACFIASLLEQAVDQYRDGCRFCKTCDKLSRYMKDDLCISCAAKTD